ncbi:aldehyde dehydrogenase family protein [Natrarchaeobius halalkaliphilus]|uniref:Aldehyde dehydrogenase family protein n=1 Tax=Natrarchaeobius halalkaliphilus TaxID=1679091 RepID=A0A3N6LNZ5_9EURY|nr:aldehyde dehydrogenase family protein [Natrarchaeobius halalkaliphilus]
MDRRDRNVFRGRSGHIIPWISPTLLAAQSIAPALAAGTTVVTNSTGGTVRRLQGEQSGS